MLRDAVAIIDCGSSKITGLIGENSINNNYAIRAYSEQPSFSLSAGGIEDPDDFRASVSKVFNAITSSARAKITEVYFSVPGDFLQVRNIKSQIYFNKKKKLRQREVDEFLLEAKKDLLVSGYELIDYSGVQYFLDGQKKVTSLIGEASATISGITTFYFAKSNFIRLVKELMSRLGVKTVHFVPVPLAESMLLFPEKDRFAFEVLLDIGTSVANFSIAYGGGILYNESFEIGGGYINAFLMQEFNLDTYELAEKLKRKLNLTIPPESSGVYEVLDGDRMLRFSQRACNQVAEGVITKLAEYVDTAIKNSNVRLPQDYNISLTGGGIAYIRGAREYLFKLIGIPVNIVCPKISYMAKPEETSKIAVLNYALNGRK